jgi:uncharacterized protein YjbI with pentapeptide repeats
MAKQIKFNLVIDGNKVSTFEEMQDNLSAELLPHLPTGKLAKWFLSRELADKAAAVQAIDTTQTNLAQLTALCEVLELEADEDILADILAMPEQLAQAQAVQAKESTAAPEVEEESYTSKPSYREDWSGRDLSGRLFIGEDFSNYNFAGANLSGCDFSGANLSGANFEGATLDNANFEGADLSNADLTSCIIDGDGDGDGVSVNGNNINTFRLFLAPRSLVTNFKGANLSHANFYGSTISFAEFEGADLSYANFSKTHFHLVSFNGANLVETNFTESSLYNSIFIKSNIIKNNFSFSELVNVTFDEVEDKNLKLTGCIFEDVKGILKNKK